MKKIVLFCIILFNTCAYSKECNTYIVDVTKPDGKYRDFVILKNKLFAINERGQILIWNFDILERIKIVNPPFKDKFSAIYKSELNQIYLGTLKGKVFLFDYMTYRTKLVHNSKYSIHSLCVNSFDNLFLEIFGAIYAPIDNKLWYEFEDYHSSIKRIIIKDGDTTETNKYLALPDFTFLDKAGLWWLIGDDGEWGTEKQIFDTKNKCIYKNQLSNIDLGLIDPISIFADNNRNTIIVNSGFWLIVPDTTEIFKIDENGIGHKIECIFEDNNVYDTSTNIKIEGGITNVIAQTPPIKTTFSLNIAAFNPYDTCIYIETSIGLYKANLPSGASKIYATLVYESDLSAKKMEFIDRQKLLILNYDKSFNILDNGFIQNLK